MFPTVHRTGAIGTAAMTRHAVNEMIRHRAGQAGFTPAQSAPLGGHSLRSGFVTEAFPHGATVVMNDDMAPAVTGLDLLEPPPA